MLETLPMWSNVQPQLQPHLGKPLTLSANVLEISAPWRQLPPVFSEETKDLRNKLLSHRLENYERITPDESKLLGLEPRGAQIATSICAVATTEHFRSKIIEWMKERESQALDENPQTWAARAILNLTGEKECDLWVKDVATEAQAIRQNLVGAGLVIGHDFLSPKRVGGIIRSFGFVPLRTNAGYYFKVDAKKLEQLKRKYATPEIESK